MDPSTSVKMIPMIQRPLFSRLACFTLFRAIQFSPQTSKLILSVKAGREATA